MNEFVLARGLYRGATFALVLVGLALLGLQVKWLLVQLFAAAIVAAGMAPIVARLASPRCTRSRRRRPPPALVVLLIYLIVGLVVLVLGSLLLRVVLTQGTLILERVPHDAVVVSAWYAELGQRWPLLEQLDLLDLVGGTSGLTQTAVGTVRQVLNVASLLLALFGGALNVVFVLFMALYLTVDGPAMRDYLLVFLPASRQPQARRVITNISWRLGQWAAGELILCTIIGVGAGLGLGLIGVPGAPLLALVWAGSELVPGIGPFISAAPSIALGFLAGPETGILATLFTLVWSQIETNIVVPRVMGRAVRLNPLVVLVALLAGNELLGLAGALFSIPAAAAIAVIVDELRDQRLLQLQAAALPATTPHDAQPGAHVRGPTMPARRAHGGQEP
jgi:predicted PurR-regulated permease PerM